MRGEKGKKRVKKQGGGHPSFRKELQDNSKTGAVKRRERGGPAWATGWEKSPALEGKRQNGNKKEGTYRRAGERTLRNSLKKKDQLRRGRAEEKERRRLQALSCLREMRKIHQAKKGGNDVSTRGKKVSANEH